MPSTENNSTINSQPVFGMHLLHPRYWLNWFMLLLLYLLSWMPLRVIDANAKGLSRIAYWKNEKRVRFATINLRLCFPDKSEQEIQRIVKRVFANQFIGVFHYGLLWWAPTWRLRRMVDLQGADEIVRAQSAGRKVIIMTVHSTGLEFLGVALSLKFACSGPYRHMKNKLLNWLVVRGRSRFGTRAYTREDGFRPLIRDTKQGRILIYLADEDLGNNRSVFAPLFGVPKATVPILGRLAKRCDAEIIPCVSRYDSKQRKYIVKVFPAIDALDIDDDEKAAMQMNGAIEQAINECLEQYFWTLKLFKTRPNNEPSVYL